MKIGIFLIVLVVPVVLLYEFPAKFARCHLNDPHLDGCLRSTIESAIHLISSTGIQSLHLPSIEPVEFDKLEIAAGSRVALLQKYSDLKIYGYSDSKVDSAHFDLDNKVLTFTTSSAKIEQKAKYEISGKIMAQSVFGSGNSVITLYRAKLVHTINFKEENRNGDMYYKIKSYKITINIEDAKYQFDNLFNGDQTLADPTLKAMNDNALTLFEDVKGGILPAYADVFKKVAMKFFDNIPVKDIFIK